jgi:hypothetical protein
MALASQKGGAKAPLPNFERTINRGEENENNFSDVINAKSSNSQKDSFGHRKW